MENRKPTSHLANTSPPDGRGGVLSSAKLSPRLLSAVSLTGIGSVLTMAASSLAGIAVARNGGPSGYGVFVAANMLVFVPAVLSSFGLPLALAKHAASEEELGRHEALKHVLTSALICLLFVTLLAGIAIALNLPRLQEHLNVSIGRGFALAFPCVILSAVISDFTQGIYIGLLRLRAAIAITVSGPLLVILYSFLRSSGATLPIWGSVALLYLTSGTVAACYLIRDRLLGPPAGLGEMKPLVKDLLPAAAFTFFTIFSSWSDRWIVGTQLGEVAIGSYAAAVVVIQAALRVPKHIAYLLVPAAARMAIKGAEQGLNNAAIGLFGLFASLITVILMLASSSIISLLFGPGFLPAGPVLLVMAPSLLASAVSIPFVSVLTGSTKNRFVTYLLALTILPRILLLLFFTKWWGLQGTALATVTSEGTFTLFCVLLGRTIGMTVPLSILSRPLLLGLLAYAIGLAALFMRAPAFVAAALAILIFARQIWKSIRAAYSGNVIFETVPNRLDGL
ncbi:MAG: lipopolysaccharide biosynthesis protein [Pyrinomonadaceae bacterium]